jgi:hypothetical protein
LGLVGQAVLFPQQQRLEPVIFRLLLVDRLLLRLQHLELFLLVEVEVLALGVLVQVMAALAVVVVGLGQATPRLREPVIHLHNRLPEGMAHQQLPIKDSMVVLVILAVRRLAVLVVVVAQVAQVEQVLHQHQEKQEMEDLLRHQQLQALL